MSMSETNQVGSNSRAKKRRRWSTNQEDAILNRLGGKGRILGRQPTSTGNSLSSFQSKSNPIFEPAPGAVPSCGGAGRFRVLRNPTLQRISGAGREADKPTTRSLKSFPSSRHSNGWAEDDMESSHTLPRRVSEIQEDRVNSCLAVAGRTCEVESSPECLRLPPPSPVRTSSDGGGSIDCPRTLDDSLADRRSLEDCERRCRELVENVQANAAAEVAHLREYMSLVDYLRSKAAICEAESKQYSELHRDAVVQLLSARDKYTNLTREKDEVTTAKEELQQKLSVLERERDAEANIRRNLQAKLEIVEDERDLLMRKVEKIETEWRAKLETVEKERDLLVRKVEKMESEWGAKLEVVENERDSLLRKVEKMETEWGALRDAVKMLQEERDFAVHDREGNLEIKEVPEGGSTDLAAPKSAITQPKAVNCKAEISSKVNAREVVLSSTEFFKTHHDFQLQPSDILDEKDKLARERDELQIAVRTAEQRVADAEKERDDVVLAVKSEWDAVKVALREDKQRLEQELETLREKKLELERELDSARISLRARGEELEGQRAENKKIRNERDAIAIAMTESLKKVEGERDGLKIVTHEEMRKWGREGGDANVIASDENKRFLSQPEAAILVDQQKKMLEIQLSDVRDANSDLQIQLFEVRDEIKRLESEREALIAALIVVREENKKLEGELVTTREAE